jgi:MOSC domain-containing protein YiiM
MSIIGKVEAICIKEKVTRFPQTTVALAEVSLEGFVGDCHSGFIRSADSREKGIARGTPIRNARQWSAVSVEELEQIASNMGFEEIEPWKLAANLTLSGIPNLTALPRGTQLRFEDGPILVVEEENLPCTHAGKEVVAGAADKTPQQFVKAAMHLRGVVGVVHLPGTIRVGESVTVIPPA